MTATPSQSNDAAQLCGQAQRLRDAGRIADAKQLYREALLADPYHFQTLFQLGALSAQTGEAAAGVDLLQRAVSVAPRVPEAHCMLGLALMETGGFADAAQAFARAMALKPAYAWAQNLHGLALCRLGRQEEALPSFAAAAVSLPTYAEAHFNRAVALNALGRDAEALAAYDTALALEPGAAAFHMNHGATLSRLGRLAEAAASFGLAAALQPSAQSHLSCSIALTGIARFPEALASAEAAIRLAPASSEAHDARGSALIGLGRLGEALAAFDQAIALTPGFAQAHTNRGTALERLQRFDDAIASHQAAIALEPELALAHYNLGAVQVNLGRYDAALASYDRAITLQPDYAQAIVNRGYVHLRQGRFEAGWRDYEWRKRLPGAEPPLSVGRLWTGAEPLEGKHIFVRCEQGLGDTIQFARYIPLLEQRGARVSFAVQGPLMSLLRQVSDTAEFLAEDATPETFDYHCDLLSLPGAFGTTLETIPAQRPLRAAPERRERFARLLGPRARPRVGLAWSGNPAHDNDRNRSIAFARLAPLLAAHVDWIALQPQINPTDQAAFQTDGRVAFHGEAIGDFADTAALLDLMDLVITVDTSLAHLAGAMGKPVWVLLPFAPDWRWLLEGRDSPWHPSTRLFRQARIGDWESVIEEVGGELAEYFGSPTEPV